MHRALQHFALTLLFIDKYHSFINSIIHPSQRIQLVRLLNHRGPDRIYFVHVHKISHATEDAAYHLHVT